MSSRIRFLLAASLISLFTACGGGGGDSVAPPVTTIDTYQFKTAWVNYFNDSSTLNFTVSGMVSGVTISGTGKLTQGVPSTGTFENVVGLQKTSVVTGNLTGTLNGVVVTVPLDATSTSYVDTNYLPLGQTDAEGGYVVVTGTVTIPQTVKIGDTGPLYAGTFYSSSAKISPLGTFAVSYAVKPDTITGSDALLSLIEVDQDASTGKSSTSTRTFRMTSAGGLTRLSEVSVAGADTLTITYQ
jgi:hypothetical protein